MITGTLPARLRLVLAVVSCALAVVAIVPSPALATTPNPYLVKNINPNGSSDPQSIVALGNRVFFTADDGVHGRELWVSDGTSAGTYMVKDILPGVDADYAPYWPLSLAAINGVLYFSATDGVHGYEPWISDGTEAGTHMIKDIVTSSFVFGSDPGPYVPLNGLVYFSAYSQAGGRELWRTDGTEDGTKQVADITPGTGGSYPEYMVAFKNRVYFLRQGVQNRNQHSLFRSDGTAAGTKAMRDHNGNKIKGTFNYGVLQPVGDHLFFDRTHKQVWSSGGTPATTGKLVDFGTREIVGVDGIAYFTSDDSDGSHTLSSFLWRSDGTSAGTQPLMYADGSSIIANFLTPLGNNLIFWGADNWEGGSTPHTGGLSISDGTQAGTVPLGVYALPFNYYDKFEPTPRATLNSVLYFPAQTYDGTGNFSDVALWRTDGTTGGTYAVSPTYSSNVLDGVTAAGNRIFFVTKAGKGSELYAYAP